MSDLCQKQCQICNLKSSKELNSKKIQSKRGEDKYCCTMTLFVEKFKLKGNNKNMKFHVNEAVNVQKQNISCISRFWIPKFVLVNQEIVPTRNGSSTNVPNQVSTSQTKDSVSRNVISNDDTDLEILNEKSMKISLLFDKYLHKLSSAREYLELIQINRQEFVINQKLCQII